MKEKKDIGLSYLRQLEIDPPKESKLLYFRFSAKYGETRGRSMLTDLYRKIRVQLVSIYVNLCKMT